jgi:hypothetical protein
LKTGEIKDREKKKPVEVAFGASAKNPTQLKLQ